MTILTRLDVVNDCLALLGELPLNSLEDDHDLTTGALNALTRANAREQAKSWWFNQEHAVLSPDPIQNNNIMLPMDVIRVDPLDGSLDYVARGRRLYKQYAGPLEDKFTFSAPVTCKLVRLIPFEDLPATAQLLVAASAKLDFGKNYDADTTRNGELKLEYKDAFITLNAEHIRNVNVNLITRPSMVRKLNQLGHNNLSGGLLNL